MVVVITEEAWGINIQLIHHLSKSTPARPVFLRQVRSAVSLSREASGRPPVEAVPGEEALALQEAGSGAVRLRAGDPFPEEMSALWLAVQSLGFTLVCEPHENLPLAEGTLRNLTRHCLEHLHMLGPGSEVRTPSEAFFRFHMSRFRVGAKVLILLLLNTP